MKIMNKLQNKLKKANKDNKGFSLVELIIVIAIMAILVGIVGTQVIPYLGKSKAAKDQQVLNSFSTAAVTAFSENAEKMPTTGTFTVDMYTGTYSADPEAVIVTSVKSSVGYDGIDKVKKQFSSEAKTQADDIELTFDVDNHKLTASIKYASGATIKYEVKDVTATL